MKPEEVKIALERARADRERLIKVKLRDEERSWQRCYIDNPHFLEKLLIKKLCRQFTKLENLGKEISITIPVENTRFSADKYINLEQLTSVFVKAGLNENNVNVHRNINGNQTCISIKLNAGEIDYSSKSVLLNKADWREEVSFTDDELDFYINHGHPNWLVSFFSEYLTFRSTKRGKALTEREMAMAYYEQLTDQWDETNKAFAPLQPPIPVYTNLINKKEILKEEFGDFQNVLNKLTSALDDSGFAWEIENYTSHEFRLSMKERDHILDNEQSIPQTLL